MLTENLTIYRDTFELCRLMMLYLDSVPRSHRFGEYGWNKKKEHSEETRRKLMVRMNSYYGMLLHPRAYRIRRKMWFSLQDKKGLVNISMKRINTIRI